MSHLTPPYPSGQTHFFAVHVALEWHAKHLLSSCISNVPTLQCVPVLHPLVLATQHSFILQGYFAHVVERSGAFARPCLVHMLLLASMAAWHVVAAIFWQHTSVVQIWLGHTMVFAFASLFLRAQSVGTDAHVVSGFLKFVGELHVVSAPAMFAPAALVSPAGQSTQSFDTTLWLMAQRMTSGSLHTQL